MIVVRSLSERTGKNAASDEGPRLVVKVLHVDSGLYMKGGRQKLSVPSRALTFQSTVRVSLSPSSAHRPFAAHANPTTWSASHLSPAPPVLVGRTHHLPPAVIVQCCRLSVAAPLRIFWPVVRHGRDFKVRHDVADSADCIREFMGHPKRLRPPCSQGQDLMGQFFDYHRVRCHFRS